MTTKVTQLHKDYISIAKCRNCGTCSFKLILCSKGRLDKAMCARCDMIIKVKVSKENK